MLNIHNSSPFPHDQLISAVVLTLIMVATVTNMASTTNHFTYLLPLCLQNSSTRQFLFHHTTLNNRWFRVNRCALCEKYVTYVLIGIAFCFKYLKLQEFKGVCHAV